MRTIKLEHRDQLRFTYFCVYVQVLNKGLVIII